MSAKFYNFDDPELFEDITQDLDPANHDRQERRKRKKKPQHQPKKSPDSVVQALADDSGLAGGFTSTYKPSKHEAEWLLQSLQSFYYQDLITDVLAVIKGGKEATVYRCAAHPSTGYTYVAAKVYRPRMFRQLRNDGMYREGREVLGLNGKALNNKDWRARKAMNKGGDFGQALEHTSWLMYEFSTLKTLREAGASVPEAIAASENALLMSYHGDEHLPAPTLSEVHLDDSEVLPFFKEVMRNIDLMLNQNMIHGDLSAFNILYDAGKAVLIDFPQVVNIENNPHSRKILTRDITRVCEYFQSHGMIVDADEISRKMWSAFGKPDIDPEILIFNILEAVSFDDYELPDYD